jgi:hypothetical protein
VPEVERLLAQAREQQQRQGEQHQEQAHSPTGPAEAVALEAPHRYSDLDRQLLHQQQQQYLADAAASATQALSAAAATASWERLDEYLVGEGGCWRMPACLSSALELCIKPDGSLWLHITLVSLVVQPRQPPTHPSASYTPSLHTQPTRLTCCRRLCMKTTLPARQQLWQQWRSCCATPAARAPCWGTPCCCRRWPACSGRMPRRAGSCASACWPFSVACRTCRRPSRCCRRCVAGWAAGDSCCRVHPPPRQHCCTQVA